MERIEMSRQRPLAEELVLVSRDPKSGHRPLLLEMNHALQAASIIELLLHERIKVEGGQVCVTDARGIGDSVSDNLLEEIRSSVQRRSLRYWLGAADSKRSKASSLEYKVLMELVSSDVLLFREGSMFRLERYPLANFQAREQVVGEVLAAIEGKAPCSPREALLVTLLHTFNILSVLEVKITPAVRRRLTEIRATTPLSEELSTAMRVIVSEAVATVSVLSTAVRLGL